MIDVTLYIEADTAFEPVSGRPQRTTWGIVVSVGATQNRTPWLHNATLLDPVVAGPLRAILKPWTWRRAGDPDEAVPGLIFRALTRTPGYADLSRNGCWFAEGLASVVTSLDVRCTEFITKGGMEIANSGGQVYALDHAAVKEGDGTEAAPNTISWPNVLADAATLPGAVGRGLGLLYGFSVPNATRVSNAKLCPSFEVTWSDATGLRRRVMLSPTGNGSTDEGYAYQFTGDNDKVLEKALTVRCMVNRSSISERRNVVSRQAGEPVLDRRTGWVQLPKSVALGTRDFIAEFPSDVQAALDLPDLFILSAADILEQWQRPPVAAGESGAGIGAFRGAPRPDKPLRGATGSLADVLTRVFMRLIGPMFALGVPPLAALTDQDVREDWVRKSLLFDAVRGGSAEGEAAEELRHLLGPVVPRNVDAEYAAAILAKARGLDRIFEPDAEFALEPGSPDPESKVDALAVSLAPLAIEFGVGTDFANLSAWLAPAATPETATVEPATVEAVLRTAADRLAALRRIAATMRADDFHRRAISIIFREAGEGSPGAAKIAPELKRWALSPALEAAARSQTAGRALRDRLRPLIESRTLSAPRLADGVLALFGNGMAARDQIFAAFGADLGEAAPSGALGMTRTQVKRAGVVAVIRAVSPFLDESTQSFEGEALLAISRAIARGLVARVDRTIGATDEGEGTSPVRLEPPVLCERPQPLVVPVGRIASGPDGPLPSAAYAGFGVLVRAVRKGKPQPWHCLTTGMPQLVRKPDRSVTTVGLGHAPVRIVEQSDFASWLMVYDGAPLSALPLRYNPLDVPSFRLDGVPTGDVEMPRVVIVQPELGAYRACLDGLTATDECRVCGAEGRLFKLVALKYGETLEFSFFVQKNNGFLPVDVAAASDPALFRLPTTTTVPGGKPENDFSRSIRIRHLRRTAVSVPRLVGPQQSGDPQAFNRAFVGFEPPKVDRELIRPLLDVAIGEASREPRIARDDQSRERSGFILLAPCKGKTEEERKRTTVDWAWQSTFEFGVLPPAVTIADWERWRLKDLVDAAEPETSAAIRNEIIATLSAYDRKIGDLETGPPAEAKAQAPERKGGDVAPDDPAVVAIGLRLQEVTLRAPTVSNATAFELTVVGTALLPLVQPLAPAPEAAGDALSVKVLKTPIHVTLEAGPDRTETPARIIVDSAVNGVVRVRASVAAGRMYQLDIVALTSPAHYADPADPDNDARFRAPPHALLQTLPNLEPGDAATDGEAWAWRPAALSATFAGFVEASRTAIDVEVATELMPETHELFDAVDVIGEEGGDLLVGFVPPDEPMGSSLFRYVAEATLARQRWRWTGRTSGRAGEAAGEAGGHLDVREVSEDVWRRTAALFGPAEATRRHGMRLIGRAALEPAYGEIESGTLWGPPGEAVKAWRRLIETDGEWFGAISDANRFEETGQWPTLVPSHDAFSIDAGPQHELEALRARGLVLARIPLAQRPQAQYWRFGAVATSRYRAIMRRRADADPDPGRTTAPWRRLVLAPARFDAPPPAPRLRLMIPLPAPIATATDSRENDDEWASFLAVFDETWGDVGGLAEFIEAEVALTTDTDEQVRPETNALTAIFRPCYQIPEFGFDPILRASDALSESGMTLDPRPIDGCVDAGQATREGLLRSIGSPIGLTFESALDAVPVRSMVEVRLNAKAARAIKGGEGDRIFAEAFFRREVRRWAEPAVDGVRPVYRSQRTRLEWVLFGASNTVWRMSMAPDHSRSWVHVSQLRLDRDFVFHATTPAGESLGKVNLYATNASEPSRSEAPRTTLVRRLAVVLTYTTRGAGGEQRSEVFLGAGMVAERDLDIGQTVLRSLLPGHPDEPALTAAIPEAQLRRPFYWFDREVPKSAEILARLVELEFHAAHRDYLARAITVGGTEKRFFVERGATLPTGADRIAHDHPMFEAIFGVDGRDGGRDGGQDGGQDALARVCRISPPIPMLAGAKA